MSIDSMFKEVDNENFDSLLMSFATDLIKRGIKPEWYNIYIWKPTEKKPCYDLVLHTSVDGKMYFSYGSIIRDLKIFRNSIQKEHEFADLGYDVKIICMD